MNTNNKGQRNNRSPIETLAYVLLGVRDGPATSFWKRARRGFDSPHVQPNLKFLPARGSSRSTGNVLGYEPRTGLETRCHFGSESGRKQEPK